MILSCVFLFSDSCSWVLCLYWTVKLSAVLQKNPSAPTNYLVFQHCCVFESFPTMTVCMILISIFLFTPRTTEGLICIYYRRLKCSLMLQKKKTCIKSQGVENFEQNEDVYICLVLPKCQFFFILYCPSEATEDSYMFSRRQIKLNLPWSSNVYVYVCVCVCVCVCVYVVICVYM